MDTRFWGPAGWKLLHLIAHEPHRTPKQNAAVAKWFSLLPFVLPCKFCRASLTDYMKLEPLTAEIIDDREQFGRWIYELHNRVNAKLRSQGLLRDSGRNPSWTSVKSHYDSAPASAATEAFPAWDFLIAVAFTTPGPGYTPTPMPDLPEGLTEGEMLAWCPVLRNRYNLLTREERLVALEEWWTLLPDVLPSALWRDAWPRSSFPPLDDGKDAMMKWIWQQESAMCRILGCPPPHSSETALCRAAELYESGCGSAMTKRAKTCRRLLRSQTRRHQRKHHTLQQKKTATRSRRS